MLPWGPPTMSCTGTRSGLTEGTCVCPVLPVTEQARQSSCGALYWEAQDKYFFSLSLPPSHLWFNPLWMDGH